MRQNGKSWKVEIGLRGSGRITLERFGASDRRSVASASPTTILRELDALLRGFRAWDDELTLVVRDTFGTPSLYVTRSRASALYWCATLFTKLWPPVWVPLVDRRAARCAERFPDAFPPPLVERRTH